RLDFPRADALYDRLLDHADQRLLAPLPVLNETRHVTAFPYLRHLQAQRTQSRIPSSLAVPVSIPRPFVVALVRLGADLLGHLRLHDEVGDHLCHRSQRVLRRVRRLDELVRQFIPVYSVFGHPFVSSFRESWTLPLEPAAAGLCQDLNLHSGFYAAPGLTGML